jgi:aspartyl-tRNA(Asn)/glutamyl-tRNA(Gln) amidotransferase subunit B
MEYIPTIGLEIHIELKTESKMFCSCANDPNETEPNKNVCPVCLGHPGTLPVANAEAIKKVRLVGLALNSQVQEYSKFDRKNYFYPDLPKGYQISQYDQPLCLGGYLEVKNNGAAKKIRITRVHLEEDTAKLVHPEGEDSSLVDFNRSGVPLMELVTEPDIENAAQAREFVQELQLILRYLDVSDADMEKGMLRVEVNISLSSLDAQGNKQLGTKVEIKNLNSLRAVEGAVAFEIGRQTELVKHGEKVAQETRGWDDARLATFSQREKEEAHDYRYFPEPDIPPMVILEGEIEKLRALVGELPAKKRDRFLEQFGLDSKTVEIFVVNRPMADYFEKTNSELEEWINTEEADASNSQEQSKILAKLCANYLTTDVQGLLKGAQFNEKNFLATPENFAEFIKLIYKKEISSKIAKAVLVELTQRGGDPTEIITKMGLSQISDTKHIDKVVDKVLQDNAKAVDDYKNGKGNAFQFLVGQVLAATQGRANPDMVRQALLDRLSKTN